MGNQGELGVPRVISLCCEYIEKSGLEVEGVFRRSPSVTSLTVAKDAFERGAADIDVEKLGGVHVAAVLLKCFLRELEDPVFPRSQFVFIRSIFGMCYVLKEDYSFVCFFCIVVWYDGVFLYFTPSHR